MSDIFYMMSKEEMDELVAKAEAYDKADVIYPVFHVPNEGLVLRPTRTPHGGGPTGAVGS